MKLITLQEQLGRKRWLRRLRRWEKRTIEAFFKGKIEYFCIEYKRLWIGMGGGAGKEESNQMKSKQHRLIWESRLWNNVKKNTAAKKAGIFFSFAVDFVETELGTAGVSTTKGRGEFWEKLNQFVPDSPEVPVTQLTNTQNTIWCENTNSSETWTSETKPRKQKSTKTEEGSFWTSRNRGRREDQIVICKHFLAPVRN